MIIEFELVNPKLISVNEQYMHPVRKSKSGRYVSYVCKSPYLKEVQSYYTDVLSEKISDEDINNLKLEIKNSEALGIDLQIILGVPKSQIHEHDISNFVKSIEDCISTRLKIDDRYNYKVLATKQININNDNWYMKVRINTIKLENYNGGIIK